MADGPVEQSPTDPLEHRILRVLRDAASPVKAAQLVKLCSVPKKELNRVLYGMLPKGTVALAGPATWCLPSSRHRDPTSEGPAQPSPAPKPQRDGASMAEGSGPQLSTQEEKIYSYLEATGPCRALHIAKAVGMKTAKDVNPHLYKMKSCHLLSYDNVQKEWMVCGSEDSGRRNGSAVILYQQNPVNVIRQSGPNAHIAITNSEGIQIGQGNTIMRAAAPGEGASAPKASPEVVFEVWMPEPGDGAQDAAQRVRIKKCFLEDPAIGHHSKMPTGRGPGGPGQDGRRDADLSAEAQELGSDVPENPRQEPGSSTTLLPDLEAMTLGSVHRHAAGRGL